MLRSFADELVKVAVSPLAKEMAKGTLTGMAFESLLNRDATPMSVAREGIAGGVGDVAGTALARGMGMGRIGQFFAGMIGAGALGSALRKRFADKPIRHAVDKLPDTDEFRAVKEAAATKSVLTPQSSNVSGYSYDPVTQDLNVTFKSGGTYTYKGVAAKQVRALARNKSVGKTINKIKSGAEYEKVSAEKAKKKSTWTEKKERQSAQLVGIGGAATGLGLRAAMGPISSSNVPETVAQSRARVKAMAQAMGLPAADTAVRRGPPGFVGTFMRGPGPEGPFVPSGPMVQLPDTAAREAIIAHELGHYDNSLKFPKSYHKAQQLSRKLIASPVAGAITGGVAGLASAHAPTPTYIPAAIIGAASAPLLFEEAAASARAARHMMRAHGNLRGAVRSLGLLPALATYAMPTALPMAVTMARKAYRRRSGATDEHRLKLDGVAKFAKQTAFGEDHYDEADDAGWQDKLPGGLADDKFPSDFDFDALDKGIKVELEHTKDRRLAMEVAMDHLTEDKSYYDKLEKIEKKAMPASLIAKVVRRTLAKDPDRVARFIGKTQSPAAKRIALDEARAFMAGHKSIGGKRAGNVLAPVSGEFRARFGHGEGVKTAMLRERIREGAPSVVERSVARRRQMVKAAGVAKKQITFDGLPLKIEVEPGDVRKGTSKEGKSWERKMYASYGYVPGTGGMGADGEAIDVYLAKDPAPGSEVYQVSQNKADGTFDEHKYMLGYPSAEAAKAEYLRHMPAGRFGSIKAESMAGFRSKYAKAAA